MICLANKAAGFPDCEGFPNIIIILLVLINDFFLKLLLRWKNRLPFTPRPITTLIGWEDARNGRKPGRPITAGDFKWRPGFLFAGYQWAVTTVVTVYEGGKTGRKQTSS
jgi:hypothetical protein